MFKNILLVIYSVIFLSTAVYADSRIKTTYVKSTGGSRTTTITNNEAQDYNKNVNRTQKGNMYKNNETFTYNKNRETGSSNDKALPTPYSQYDVSHISNAHKILGQLYVTMPSGASLDISPIILAESRKCNVDPLLVMTVIKFESGFNPSAVSPVGACGLMQLMPDTARSLGVTDVFSPYQNIAGGVLYIRRQLDAFGNNVAFALAAYNAGPGAVSAYGGIPPYAETINYVNLIIADYAKGGKLSLKQPPKEIKEEKEKREVDIFSTLMRMKKETHNEENE